MSQSTSESPPALAPPERTTLDEQIAEAILRAVIAGELPVGSPLPPERELAERLAVNRTSLRQALARLEQIGLVRSRQGSGTIVQDPATLTDPSVVRVLADRLGPELLDEILELRSALGGLIGRLAAEQASPTELATLADRYEAVRVAPDAATRLETELAYFEGLVAATHNRPLAALLRWVAATYGTAPEGFTAAFEDAAAVLDGLARIQRAVERGRPQAAARAVEDYLTASGVRLAEAMATRRAGPPGQPGPA